MTLTNFAPVIGPAKQLSEPPRKISPRNLPYKGVQCTLLPLGLDPCQLPSLSSAFSVLSTPRATGPS